MAVANGMIPNGNRLMQEIYDQFLVCKICYEPYKQPKTLVCLHTFCCTCIEKHQDAELERSYRYLMFSRTVKCPICRKNTDLPPGGVKRLPDNFLVANLTEVISRRKNHGKSPQCEICQPGTHVSRTAVSKCLDCSKLLCANCLDMHKKTKVTKLHSYIDADVEKDIECKVHTNEVVRFYCEPCEICICVLCTFQEHKGHEVSSFTDGLQKYSNTLDTLVGMCRDKINTVRDQLELINRCEGQLKEAEERIRDTATDSILAIRRREKEMVTNLYDTFGEEGINFIKEKQMLQETLESLQSTTNLTDVILKDKSIELLLLKREIENKLRLLLEKRMDEPPDVMMRPIPQFVPEAVRFGHLDNELTRRLSTEEFKQLQSMSNAFVQTEQTRQQEQFTTMGKPQCDYDMEMSIQTDTSFDSEPDLSRVPDSPRTSASQFTMTLPPDVMERQTMTESPALTKRKIQTMPIPQSTKETETVPVQTKSVGSVTIPPDTQNEATLTNKIEMYDDVTDTQDLIRLKSTAMETESPKMKSSGTYTEPTKCVNKGSQKERPEQYDKITFTPRIPQKDRETYTDPTYTLNFGQTFRTPSLSKGTGTKTTVLMHVGVGDHVAETRDQSVDTLWRGSITPMSTKSTMPDLSYSDQSTETDRPGMRDSCTSPITTSTHTVGTSTKPRKRITSTPRDKVPMTTCAAQTKLTMNDPVIIETNTDSNTFRNNHHGDKRMLDEETYQLFLKKFRSNMVDHITMTDEQFIDGSSRTKTEASSTLRDSNTDPVTPPSKESGTNTPTIRRKNRETETVAKETKHCGTYTFVSTIEKATYMAQPIVISTGTSTPTKTTATKKLNTPVKQYVNSSTNTPPPSRALEVPSAFKGNKNKPSTVSRGTNTPTKRFRDSGSGVMQAIVVQHEVGVLKRPHTLSRGVGTPAVRQADQASGREAPSTHEAGCTADLPTASTKVLVNRESSPIRTPIIHRATSTLSLHLVDRESSPVRFSQLCKSTSTPQLYTPSSGSETGSPDAVQTVEGDSTSASSLSSQQDSVRQNGELQENRGRLCARNTRGRMRSTSVSTNSSSAVSGAGAPPMNEKQTNNQMTLNSSTATDTILTNDAQTDADDLPRFHDMLDGAPVTVSRGTCTREYHVIHRETSPVRFLAETKPRTVDKAVMVTKADLMEPRDKFHRAGTGSKKSCLTDEDETPFRPNLAAIREDSCESRSSDEEHARSGEASPVAFYEVSAPMAEEIKSITSSIVTHTEKLWVTATQTSSSGTGESTFTADGKMSPTSILCTVEAGTSTPPVPSTEDKAVSTESVVVDTKMAECISKLKTVRQRLEQHPNTGAAVHPAPGPIYTKTQHKSICTVTQSPEKSAEVKVTSKVTSSPERPAKVKLGSKGARLKLIMGRDSSTDSGPDSPTNSITRGRKARKQRPDLSQMLKSTATTANQDSPPLPADAIPRQQVKRAGKVSPSRQPPLIPKMDMNIKDYRKHSPGVKRRSRTKQTIQGTSSLAAASLGVIKTLSDTIGVRNKVLNELAEEQQSGSDSNAERSDVKVSLSNKVDVNFLPTEDNIRRTERPLVRKLPPQVPRFQEKEPFKGSEKEPTKVHVDWHRRRFLTRQLSLDDLHRRGSLGGGGLAGVNSGSVGGGSGQALQGLIPLPVDYPQKPMKSFNYHRSTSQLQVKVPEEGSAALPSNPPAARISRRASIDVAGIGRGTLLSSSVEAKTSSANPPSVDTPGMETTINGQHLSADVPGVSRGTALPPSAPRRRSLIITPEFSTLKEDTPLVDINFVPEENNQSSPPTQQSGFGETQTNSMEDKNQDRPRPPPRKTTLFRRGSVA